ncbi:hypothetical protein BD289DRAFT_177686 [Coniella lustricola]|uniref:Uncharacterized protein n=1 Tax=Coniella lustricola TaxID=2025994 RepID=A0A2T2ZTK8_9PEZI|nr:hypothetical protein BD289DRAFT_177686 [Coniella lustricola]
MLLLRAGLLETLPAGSPLALDPAPGPSFFVIALYTHILFSLFLLHTPSLLSSLHPSSPPSPPLLHQRTTRFSVLLALLLARRDPASDDLVSSPEPSLLAPTTACNDTSLSGPLCTLSIPQAPTSRPSESAPGEPTRHPNILSRSFLSVPTLWVSWGVSHLC